MQLEDPVQLAWLIYSASTLGLVLVLAWMTRRWYAASRRLICLMLVAFLATPYSLEIGSQTLVPAFMVAIFEALSGGLDAAMRAGLPILMVQLVVVSVFLVLELLWGLWRRRA